MFSPVEGQNKGNGRLAASYRVEAAELVSHHCDDDGDELPANCRAPQQLQDRGGLFVFLSTRLCVDLLQLLGYILLPQEPLESWQTDTGT